MARAETAEESEWGEEVDRGVETLLAALAKRTVAEELEEVSPELAREREIRAEEESLVGELVEEGEESCRCKACDKYFNRREFVVNHVRQHHNAQVEGVTVPVGEVRGCECRKSWRRWGGNSTTPMRRRCFPWWLTRERIVLIIDWCLITKHVIGDCERVLGIGWERDFS